MEHDTEYGYVINCERLHKLIKRKVPFTGKKYATLGRFIEKNLISENETEETLRKLHKNFQIFDFFKSKEYQEVNYDCVFIIKENLTFLEEIYSLIKVNLPDPETVLADASQFNSFVEENRKLALGLDLIPNLCSLKEWLVLLLSVRRSQKILQRNAKFEEFTIEGKEETDKILDFEEFKVLVLIFGKYMYFKYTHIYDYKEETYLQQLLWYMFLKAVNNPEYDLDESQKVMNYKLEDNILVQLNKTKLRPDHLFEEGILDNLLELFLIFANNFSRVGNPHLLLDSNKLLRHPRFQNDWHWITSYVNGHDSDFFTFLEILKRMINLRKQSSTYTTSINDFLGSPDFSRKFSIRSYTQNLPFLEEKLLVKIKRLFSMYSTNDEHLHVMDFLFMCQHFNVVPQIYTNRQIMIIFYYFNISNGKRQFRKVEKIFDAENFYYVDFIDFIRMLIEISDALIGKTIIMDQEQKLKILFKKYFRV
jgi:hypothetical protein